MTPTPLHDAPLAGKTILVTRPSNQAHELTLPLEALGATTVLQPATQILAPDDCDALDQSLRSFAQGGYDWVLFSSANGVRAFFNRLSELQLNDPQSTRHDLNSAFHTQLAVVGPGAAKALETFGLYPDLIPDVFNAEGLVDALDGRVDNYHATRILSIRASRGRRVVADALAERGAQFEEVVAYKSVDVLDANPNVLDALRARKIDAAVVTSSASAKALVKLLGDETHKTRWVAISPLTAQAMTECGVNVDAIAKEASMTSTIDAIVQLFRR